MVYRGHIKDGVVVLDDPSELPEGAAVRIEVVEPDSATEQPIRRGSWWKGQVTIADDFDEMPDDIADAFGMRTPY